MVALIALNVSSLIFSDNFGSDEPPVIDADDDRLFVDDDVDSI